MGGDHHVHVEGHDQVRQALHLLVGRAVVAAEISADLGFALIEQVVVNRRDRIDHQRAEVVLFGQQRFDLRYDILDIGGLENDRAGCGNDLVVVLRAALAVDDVGIGELNGGRGFTDAGRAKHE